MRGDETELLRSLLSGMTDTDVKEAVEALNDAPEEKPNGRRRRASRPSALPVRAGMRRQSR